MKEVSLRFAEVIMSRTKLEGSGMVESQSEHVANLARELLDDIELSRVPPQALLLKAARLARFVGTEEIRVWLALELNGYRDGNAIAKSYLARTARWIDKDKRVAYWGGFAEQVAMIESFQAEQQTIRIPDVSGDLVVLALNNVMDRSQAIGDSIRALECIKSRVLSLLHQWVAAVHYEATFGGAAESIFEQFRSMIDARLASVCAPVLERLPAVYDRLRSNDPESVSQAMTTCRRIIDSFADTVFPASDETLTIDCTAMKLGVQHHQNRINAFIATRTSSKTRRKRLRQTLANLYDRVCAAIHDDISPEEAQALMLQTYVFLGELSAMEALPMIGDQVSTETA